MLREPAQISLTKLSSPSLHELLQSRTMKAISYINILTVVLIVGHPLAVRAKNKNKNNNKNTNYNNWQAQYAQNTGSTYNAYSNNQYSGGNNNNKNNNNNNNYNNNNNNNNNSNNRYSSNSNNQYSSNYNNQNSVSSSTKICNPYSADDDVDCTTLQSSNKFFKSKTLRNGGGAIIAIAGIAGSLYVINKALGTETIGSVLTPELGKKSSRKNKKSLSGKKKSKKKSRRKVNEEIYNEGGDEEDFQYELSEFDDDEGLRNMHLRNIHAFHGSGRDPRWAAGYDQNSQYYPPNADPRLATAFPKPSDHRLQLHSRLDPRVQQLQPQLDPRLQQHWQRMNSQGQGSGHQPRLQHPHQHPHPQNQQSYRPPAVSVPFQVGYHDPRTHIPQGPYPQVPRQLMQGTVVPVTMDSRTRRMIPNANVQLRPGEPGVYRSGTSMHV